jgi:hypothetical protein
MIWPMIWPIFELFREKSPGASGIGAKGLDIAPGRRAYLFEFGGPGEIPLASSIYLGSRRLSQSRPSPP